MNQSKELRINRRPRNDTSDEEPSISTPAHKPVTEQKEQDIYVLSITVKSAKNLPDLDPNVMALVGKKDHTDAVCTVSFQHPTTGNSFVWRTRAIPDDLNPEWNESNSWALFFDPSDDLEITFDIVDVDTITKSDQVGKLKLALKEIDGKAKVLNKEKYGKKTTLTVEAERRKLNRVPESFDSFAKTEVVNGLQATVQKIQSETVTLFPTFVQQKEMKKQMEEFDRKLEKLAKQVGGVTAKLGGMGQFLSE